jgi:hypothetical protein
LRTDHEAPARELAGRLQGVLADWVASMPDALPQAGMWLRSVASTPDPVLAGALGIPTRPAEQDAIQAMLAEGAHPVFDQFHRDFHQRLDVYLGGIDGLARAADATEELRAQHPKLVAIREVLARDSHHTIRPKRSLAAIVEAVKNDSLRGYRTGDVDSDLWVVLKTLQENLARGHASLEVLIKFVARIVELEATYSGQHISDRRHAWWAVRTLHEASRITENYLAHEELERFVTQLLSEPLYKGSAPNQWLSPEFSQELTLMWELTNITELLVGNWQPRFSAKILDQLYEREERLMVDLLGSQIPKDMRLATVSARACLTFLSHEPSEYWGRDA